MLQLPEARDCQSLETVLGALRFADALGRSDRTYLGNLIDRPQPKARRSTTIG
jgi:hypothetical protein